MRFITIRIAVFLIVLSGLFIIAVKPASADKNYIGNILPPTTLYGPHTSAEIWAEMNVPAEVTITRVWAEIYPPGSGTSVIIDLEDADDDGRYSTTDYDFISEGDYGILIRAVDSNGTTAFPKDTYVSRRELTADEYEQDDTFEEAGIIVLNDPTPQTHNFHDPGDADWVIFYGLQGKTYTLRADNVNASSNAVIELYDTDGLKVLKSSRNDESTAGTNVSIDWISPEDGIYPVKITNFNSNYFGENIVYEFEIYRPSAAGEGILKGKVHQILNDDPIYKARIRTTQSGSAISEADGSYILYEDAPSAGTSYTLIAEAGGYRKYEKVGILFDPDEATTENIPMTPDSIEILPGDLYPDGKWDLDDLILGLQTAAGMDVSVSFQADVDGDGRIGLEEAIYILQKISLP